MSIAAAYATSTEYRAMIGMTDMGQDAEIETDLRAISRYIDGEMRRFFSRDAVPVIRIYNPKIVASTLNVDDISDVPTQIRVDTAGDGSFTTNLMPADYILLPRNANRNPEAWPFTQIELPSWRGLANFVPGQQVEITARFGWPAVPDAIRRATIHLTAILRLETPRATKRVAELGDTVETSQQAQNIIKQLTYQYKKWMVG